MANRTDHYDVAPGTTPNTAAERHTTVSTSSGGGGIAGFAVGALVVILVAFGIFAFFGASDEPAPTGGVETTIEAPAADTAAPEAAAPEAAAPAEEAAPAAPAEETAPAAPADDADTAPAAQ